MIRVAAYCRVSTDREDQSNSFEAQQRYFRDCVQQNAEWELYNIYADEGITGTSTKKRIRFNRMIDDALAGRFQLILTKEVSRFSRNILDTIRYTRELKHAGVAVRFLTDGIDTFEADAELRLSIMASIAQEESRKTSSRVTWGQIRQMEKGIVFGRSLLGYDVIGGELRIEPEGAEIVRLIFQKYAEEQMSTSQIVLFLNEKGYRTYAGGNWSANAVIRILKNEKYVGDLIQRKTYTPDYLTHEKRKNTGQVPYVCIENHHEPIVGRTLWNRAQERLMKNRKNAGGMDGHSNRYLFSGKIRCGICGKSFVGRYRYRKDGTKVRRWSCATAAREGRSACEIRKLVLDDDARNMLKLALKSLQIDVGELVNAVTDLALSSAHSQSAGNETAGELRRKIHQLQKKREAVMDSYFSGEISKEDMHVMLKKYDGQSKQLEEKQTDCYGPENVSGLEEWIRLELTAILQGERENDAFGKCILDSLTVHRDRHMELRLKDLPIIFHFSE